MAELPFLKENRRSGAGADVNIGPQQGYSTTQGGAPAGEWFGNDLPVHGTHGGNAFTEGFRPNNANPPLPAPGTDEGVGLPPGGSRR